MSSKTVARRYATALVDVVSDPSEQRAVQVELLSWQRLIDSSERLQEVVSNPTIAYDQKRKVLEELINRTKVQQATANFLRVLLKNQRLTELAGINEKLASLIDERSGVVAAYVTTARPVSEEVTKTLSSRLATVTGKDVRLSFSTDEALIGGMVARVGSTVFDGSVRTQLDEMRRRLSGR